jgi:hypothetical protein
MSNSLTMYQTIMVVILICSYATNRVKLLKPMIFSTAEDPHHPSLCITLKHVSTANRSFCNLKYKQWNFKKANIQQLYDNLSKINWSFLHNCDNVNYACLLFYNKLYSVFDTCVAKTHCGNSKSFPPWFTANIIKKIKCKWQLWRSYKKNQSITNYNKFTTIRAESKKESQCRSH